MATINEKGVLVYKSEIETGTSKAGNPYSRMTIVVSCDGRNPGFEKVALSVFGDRCKDADTFKVGDRVEVQYSINAREWNGKWYNDVSIFTIKADGVQAKPVTIPTPVTSKGAPIEEEFPF